jgi:hypothetical protein
VLTFKQSNVLEYRGGSTVKKNTFKSNLLLLAQNSPLAFTLPHSFSNVYLFSSLPFKEEGADLV